MQSQLFDAGGTAVASLQKQQLGQAGQHTLQQNISNNNNDASSSGNAFSSASSSSTNSYPEYHLQNGTGYALPLASGSESSVNNVSVFTPTSFKMQADPATVLSSSSSGISTANNYMQQQSFDGPLGKRKSNGLLDSTLAAMSGSPAPASTSREPSAASTASTQSQSQMQRNALSNSTNGAGMHLAGSTIVNNAHQGSSLQPGLSNNNVYSTLPTQQAGSGNTNLAIVNSDNMSEEDNQQSAVTQVALAACEDLANTYNRIANVLSQGTSLDQAQRMSLRHDFVNAVSQLDRAFFLSPSAQGYVGPANDSLNPLFASTRKRAFTRSSADGSSDGDPNKHRRTGSELGFATSNGEPISVVSPPSSITSSVPSYGIPQRPQLFHHTHSSPLLPVESHYRAGTAGISEPIPAPKAADLAASGSHHVGKLSSISPSNPTPLSSSVLASDDSIMGDSSIYTPSLSAGDANASGDMGGNAIIPSSGMPTPQALTSTSDSHQNNILSPIPQIPLTQALQAAVAGSSAMDLSGAPMDPQTYAQQALRTQQIHLAAQQQASIVNAAAAAGLHPLHTQIEISPSATPVPFSSNNNASINPMMLPSGMTGFHNGDQGMMSSTGQNTSVQSSPHDLNAQGGQTYITPPMSSIAQFSADSGFSDMDMNDVSNNIDSQHTQTLYGLASTPQSKNTGGTTTPLNSAQRNMNPANLSLDFTTLRGVKEEDSAMTSPFASSHASMSSFPFTNSGASVTSGSRSRATSISRNTSASRSRAPSVSSITHPHFTPDAHELETILGGLNTSLPSPIEEDDVEEDELYYDERSYDQPWQNSTNDFLGESLNKSGDLSDSIERFGGAEVYNAQGTVRPKDRDEISPEMLKAYNDVFYSWLPVVCGDLEATDRKAEKIHQPLMAKKMAKLDEQHAFRPFKFRIQPFTNAFQDACREAGMSEQNVIPKMIKMYLWNQPLISRFNDDGKKTKSKGNHVWSIEARFLEAGKYEFRPPPAKIIPLPSTAAPGVRFSWSPKVLDSQCQGPPMMAEFSSPLLPPWLKWNKGTLSGTPPPDAQSAAIDIIAKYRDCSLTQNFTIAVIADDGVRAFYLDLSGNNPSQGTKQAETTISNTNSHQTSYPSLKNSGAAAQRPAGSDPSTSSTTPAYVQAANNGQHISTLLPSALPDALASRPRSNSTAVGSRSRSNSTLAKMQTNHARQSSGTGPSSPVSPQQPTFASQSNHHALQTVPFFLPTHPTDATTLASASHIKAKLVEQTTVHHENLSTLNPAHPLADPVKVSAAVDAAIIHQIAVTAQVPSMPSASEVFNATLEVSSRSQQMQQEQLSHAVAVVTGQLPPAQTQIPQQLASAAAMASFQSHPPQHNQNTSQLADFAYPTPCNTPSTRSPDGPFQPRGMPLA